MEGTLPVATVVRMRGECLSMSTHSPLADTHFPMDLFPAVQTRKPGSGREEFVLILRYRHHRISLN